MKLTKSYLKTLIREELENNKNTKNAKIVVDYAGDDWEQYARQFGLRAEVINSAGPGGGWPEIMFSGNAENLMKFMQDFFENDEEEIEYQSEFIDYE